MDPPPPLKEISTLWSKYATAPPTDKMSYSFALQPPPRWNFLTGADGAESAGAGAGAGGAGAGGKVSLGVPDHSRSHCSKT